MPLETPLKIALHIVAWYQKDYSPNLHLGALGKQKSIPFAFKMKDCFLDK